MKGLNFNMKQLGLRFVMRVHEGKKNRRGLKLINHKERREHKEIGGCKVSEFMANLCVLYIICVLCG